MRNRRAILVLAAVVAALGWGFYPGEGDVNAEETDVKEEKSRLVLIDPVDPKDDRDDPDDCRIRPYTRHMGSGGIKWVKFANSTDRTVVIRFPNQHALGDREYRCIPANKTLKVELKYPDPTSGQDKVYEYEILGCNPVVPTAEEAAELAEQGTADEGRAGPRVVIP
jgi:hypothetical protein